MHTDLDKRTSPRLGFARVSSRDVSALGLLQLQHLKSTLTYIRPATLV